MSRCGDVYENRITGEYCVILRGNEDRGDGPALVHLTARPGAAVVGEHVHPGFAERFRVISGRLTAKIDGEERVLGPGDEATVEAGVRHDWWNASETEDAHVLVELQAGPSSERFELLIANLFGLANDGKVDAKGRPRPLQGVLIAQEFGDVVRFTKPPAAVQRVLVALLAPIARRRGLKGMYAEYAQPHGRTDPDPAALTAAGLSAGGAALGDEPDVDVGQRTDDSQGHRVG